ncbi:MAG: hypothetical protein JW885_05570 [Deltaproteobacteria bacterium]|nr:hypothetical protein [Candidatus Zymogenaceae bacterium]
MPKDYVHQDMNEEVTAISGHYTNEKEDTVTINGKEVLYILGHAVVDTSCCGMGGGRFALIPGYLLKHHYRTDDDGKNVSQVEPIEDDWDIKKEIIHQIEQRESYCNIRFLG